MGLKGEKSFIVVCVGRGVLLRYNKRLFIIQIDGDDTIKGFGNDKSGVFGRGI
jgi:hypothetical protein